MSVTEVVAWLQSKGSKRGLKKSEHETMAFVTTLFNDSADGDNKLTVIEFICALPELIKSLKTSPVTSTAEDDITPNTVREDVQEQLANKLSKNFDDLDVDKSGTVSVNEMW